MAQEVEFFDLHSADGPKAWSHNPWKTRMVLNYKKIPYVTKWVELCDVKDTVKATGVEPIETNPRFYSIPLIRRPQDGSYVMDSTLIARSLEADYPSPPVYPDDPLVDEVKELIQAHAKEILVQRCYYIPNSTILGPRSKEYFNTDRPKMLGMSLEEIEKQATGPQATEALEKIRPALKQFADLLKKNPDGPFFMGKTFSYADILLVSNMMFAKRMGGPMFDYYCSSDDAFKQLWDASQPWMERDDK